MNLSNVVLTNLIYCMCVQAFGQLCSCQIGYMLELQKKYNLYKIIKH